MQKPVYLPQYTGHPATKGRLHLPAGCKKFYSLLHKQIMKNMERSVINGLKGKSKSLFKGYGGDSNKSVQEDRDKPYLLLQVDKE